jgi:hypothetical protein
MEPSMPTDLDEVDLIQIHQLLGRYAHVVDRRRWDVLDQLFTADAVFDITDFGFERYVGFESVKAFFESAPHPQAHHTTNIYAWRDGVQVRSLSKWAVPGENGVLVGGDYEDTLVKIDGKWKLAERVAITRWPK